METWSCSDKLSVALYSMKSRALHHNAPRIYSRALREITPVSALYEIARDHGHSVICTAAPASPSQQ
jgi:hypothetical protein